MAGFVNNENVDNSGLARRKSFLPQRRCTLGQTSVNEQNVPKVNEFNLSSVQTNRTASLKYKSVRISSMLPPPPPGRMGTVQESVKNSTPRKASTSKPIPQEPSTTAIKARTTSVSQGTQSRGRIASHNRSSSHHVYGNTALKTKVGHGSSMETEKSGFRPMQRPSSVKKTVVSRPHSPMNSASKDAMHLVECSQLQAELAQLHLMHRSATVVQRQWERSARLHLQGRFDVLSERHKDLRQIADQQHHLINLLALTRWLQGKSAAQVADNVTAFSQNIDKVCNLIETTGKYAQIVEVFESWFAQALEKQTKPESRSLRGNELNSIKGVGDSWKAEAMVLERGLTYCLREIKAFDAVEPNSGLGRLRSLFIKLIVNLVEELDIIQWIESEISV